MIRLYTRGNAPKSGVKSSGVFSRLHNWFSAFGNWNPGGPQVFPVPTT
jgi:hypothetical protein